MKNYIVYNLKSRILRTGSCADDDFKRQAGGEYVVEGVANDITQKIEFDGLDDKGQPINPRIVDKTPEEIEMDNPTLPEMPEDEQPAQVTKGQWKEVLKKLDMV